MGREFENERHRELRHRLSGVAWNVAHLDAKFVSRLPVDDVGSRCRDGDELQIPRFRFTEYRMIDGDFVCYCHRVAL